MIRLTRYNKNKIECNTGYCPEDCNTCVIFDDIRKELAYYEDLEEILRNVLTDEIASVILRSPQEFKECLERVERRIK